MSIQPSSLDLKIHPIKLRNIQILEIFFKINPANNQIVLNKTQGPFSLTTGHTEYNSETHRIAIGVKVEIGIEEIENHPFSLRVELLGDFDVDESNFPVAHIAEWAKKNAPIILFPYLREHVYALSLRSGINPIILPLVEVPTFILPKD